MRYDLGRFRRPMRRSTEGQLASLIGLGDGSTLSLDFTAMSSLDSRFTFTRASTATYINSSGLVTTMAAASTNDPTKARFDHDPTTLAPRGLLIEGSVTNELQRSNEFNTSPWYTANFNTPTIASPAVTDPAGGTNTWYCVPSGAGSVIHGFRYNTTFTAVAYTFSIWAKAAQHDKFVISDASSGQGACRFDLTAKTANVITGIVTPTNPQIIEYPNGWFRCSFTMVMAASTRGMTYSSYPTGASIGAFGATFTATGTDGMYFYGAQTELASGPSSYIPTGASTVQRAADSMYMDGANFSAWWPNGQTEYTVYIAGDITRSPATTQFLWLARTGSGGSGSSRARTLITTSSSIRANNTVNDMISGLSATANTPFKVALAIKNADQAISVNNGTTTALVSATDTSLFADATQIVFNPNSDVFQHISSLKFWTSRLPNATIQSLTQ